MWAAAGGKIFMHEKKNFSVRLDALFTVLAVNPKGKGTDYSFEVERFFRTEAGIQKELLSRGTVLVKSNTVGKALFLVNRRPVTPEVSNALAIVLSTSAVDDTTDDEAFGTPERKRVGESWEMNRAKMTEVFKPHKDMVVKDLEGKMTLKAVVTNAPVPFMRIGMQIKWKEAPTTLTKDQVSDDITITIDATDDLPLDGNLQSVAETAEFTFSGAGTEKAANGRELETRMTLRRSKTSKAMPLQ
jgi:hypothetical protein